MNLVFCDSYSHYDTAAIPAKYSGGMPSAAPAVSIAAGAGRLAGSSCYRVPAQTPAAQVLLTSLAGGNFPALCVQAAVKITGAAGAEANAVFQLAETDVTGVQLRLHWTAAGELSVSSPLGGTLGTTSGLALATGTWYHIGMKAVIHSTAGTCEVWLSRPGQSSARVLNLSGSTTGASGIPFASLFSLGNVWAAQTDFADLAVSSDDLYGPAYVAVLRPAAAGDSDHWTPSAGAGWECVDDPAMNGDADYISSATPGQRSSYQVTPLVLPGTILGVQHVTALRKDDAGVRTARQFVRIAGADYDSAALITPGTGYVMYRQPLSVNPAGGAWTPAALNATCPGVLVVS